MLVFSVDPCLRVRWMEKVSDEQYSGLQYTGLPTKELSQ
jgi:hypothetical protein